MHVGVGQADCVEGLQSSRRGGNIRRVLLGCGGASSRCSRQAYLAWLARVSHERAGCPWNGVPLASLVLSLFGDW